MLKSIRVKRGVQLVALTALVALIALHRVQMWMLLFSVSIVLTLAWGRLYCYVCPINSLMEVSEKLAASIGIKRLLTPKWAMHPAIRYGILVVFVTVTVLMLRGGARLPIKLVLIAVGAGLSLAYAPSFWHRYLCPYGTVLSLPATFARKTYRVIKDSCKQCGLCMESCPAEAMGSSGGYPSIQPSSCLLCGGECARICPVNAIQYMK